MIEAIIFDFDGTLVDFINSDTQSLKHLHSITGSKVPFCDFFETAVEEIMRFHSLVDAAEIDPLSMHQYRLMNTCHKHKIPWNDHYLSFYKEQLLKTCVPFDGVENILSDIGHKVKLGIVSNSYDGIEQRERIRSSGLERYFDEVVVAGDVGIYKPDPGIFLYLLNRIRVAPEKSLYIGDSIKYDIEGAKTVGMHTVLFSYHSNRECSIADFTINGIKELRTLVDKLVA